MKDQAYSQLHCGWTVLHLLPPGTEQEGVKLPALGSGALLLERKTVSVCMHSACHRPPKSSFRLRHLLVNDAPASVFPLVYALILIF